VNARPNRCLSASRAPSRSSDQDVTLPQRLEAGREPGSVVALAGGQILVEALALDLGGERSLTCGLADRVELSRDDPKLLLNLPALGREG
jgi:hypothetical protein